MKKIDEIANNLRLIKKRAAFQVACHSISAQKSHRSATKVRRQSVRLPPTNVRRQRTATASSILPDASEMEDENLNRKEKRNELDDLFLQVERAVLGGAKLNTKFDEDIVHRPLPPLFHNDDEAQKAVVGKRLVTDNADKSGTSVVSPKRVKMTLDDFLMDVEIRAEKDGARTTPQIVSDKTDEQQKQNDRVLEKPLANMCSTSTTKLREVQEGAQTTQQFEGDKTDQQQQNYTMWEKPVVRAVIDGDDDDDSENVPGSISVGTQTWPKKKKIMPESYMETKAGQSTKKGGKIGSGTCAN
ncbi:hypothetical protein niasHT_005852 [Heterodera trifolii]|uniref:Uncharacterized protein n=1 Tax=Heterodera trifolii TaxID=157864 RepID=A0ABD2MCP4_9BILA